MAGSMVQNGNETQIGPQGPAPLEVPPRGGDALAFTLMAFYLLSTLTLALMAVVTSELQRRFGLTASELGLLTSVFMFVYGVSAASSSSPVR
jgi:hypothetical protein